MARASVDVLIPVYNAARFVRSAIESIQAQTLVDIRICVVDDGSTDGSAAILADMAAADRRIRVITRPNGGIVDALNAGLEVCDADFIARHDADDLAYPTRLADQVDFLMRHPEAVAVAGRARHIDLDGTLLGTLAKFQNPGQADPAHVPAREPYLLHPFLMARRDALVRAGGYRHVVHAEDADLYWRLQPLGQLHNRPEIEGEYRLHPDSISGRSIRNGRVMAVSSQLCAISAMRRAAGADDLAFTREDAIALKAAADSMEAACRVVAGPLSAEEARHLNLSAGVKLLHLAGYRPYEVEAADCIFLRQAFTASISTVQGPNRRSVRRAYAATAARLAKAGRWRDARNLLTPGLLPPFLLRLVLRWLLPSRLHGAVQTAARNLAFVLAASLGRRKAAQQ
jgi:glycosyltransferase involved in cell wall biosynthesis